MYQWDTKIHARCLCIGKEVLKYTDIKILKKVKELKKKKKTIQHEQSCEMDNKQTTGPGQKLILKGTFVIILIFQK